MVRGLLHLVIESCAGDSSRPNQESATGSRCGHHHEAPLAAVRAWNGTWTHVSGRRTTLLATRSTGATCLSLPLRSVENGTMPGQEITHLVPPRDMADGEPPRVRVRIGDTLRRTSYAWPPAVVDLLQHVEHVGFDGAPRALGFDELGREVLTFVEGAGDGAPDRRRGQGPPVPAAARRLRHRA